MKAREISRLERETAVESFPREWPRSAANTHLPKRYPPLHRSFVLAETKKKCPNGGLPSIVARVH